MEEEFKQEYPDSLADYWVKHYKDSDTGLCKLCANTGELVIERHLRSYGGTWVAGGAQYCICPNGYALRYAQTYKTP